MNDAAETAAVASFIRQVDEVNGQISDEVGRQFLRGGWQYVLAFQFQAATLAPHVEKDYRTTIEDRFEALIRLASLNPAVMIEAANRQPPGVIWTPAEAIARRPHLSGVSDFHRWLEDNDDNRRKAGVTALVGLRHEPSIDCLISSFRERPLSDASTEIIRAMFAWPALRREDAEATLRYVSQNSSMDGVAAWAAELAECLRNKSEPAPRPDWW